MKSIEAMLLEQSQVEECTAEAVEALSRLQKEILSAKKLQDKFDTGSAESEEVLARVQKTESRYHSLILKHVYGPAVNVIMHAFSKICDECLVVASLPAVLDPLLGFKLSDEFTALCKVVMGGCPIISWMREMCLWRGEWDARDVARYVFVECRLRPATFSRRLKLSFRECNVMLTILS